MERPRREKTVFGLEGNEEMFDTCNRSVPGREYEGETQGFERGNLRFNRTSVSKLKIGTKSKIEF